MNQKAMMPDASEIWANRDKYPPAKRGTVILAAIAVLVCAVGMPICLWVGLPDKVALILGIALLAVLSVYAAYICRPSATASAMILGLSYLAAISLGFASGAVVLGIVIGLGAGAFLVTATRRPYLLLGLHVLAFGVVFAVTQSVLLALLSMFSMVAALLMGVCTVRGCARTPIVLSATLGLLLPLLLFAGAWVYAEMGSLSLGAIKTVVNSLRNALLESAKLMRDELLKVAAETTAADALQQLKKAYSDEVLAGTVAQLFHYLPAIAAVGCMIPAFLGHSLLMMQHKHAGMYFVNTFAVKYLRVSLPACAVYVVSTLLNFILPSDAMASAVAGNLSLMLMPPLCVVGVTYFTVGLRQSGVGQKAMPLLILMAICCCSSGALFVVAFYGAWVSFMMHLGSRMAKKSGTGAFPDDRQGGNPFEMPTDSPVESQNDSEADPREEPENDTPDDTPNGGEGN